MAKEVNRIQFWYFRKDGWTEIFGVTKGLYTCLSTSFMKLQLQLREGQGMAKRD